MDEIYMTLIIAGAALLPVGVIIWRMDRYYSRRLTARIAADQVTHGDKEVALMERRTAATIAEQTLDATVARDKARLALETAELAAHRALIDETQDDRLEAERRVIAGRADAAIAAEPELIRARAARTLSPQMAVQLYREYRAMMGGTSSLHFNDFVEALPD